VAGFRLKARAISGKMAFRSNLHMIGSIVLAKHEKKRKEKIVLYISK
jgi:hypothetical protein